MGIHHFQIDPNLRLSGTHTYIDRYIYIIIYPINYEITITSHETPLKYHQLRLNPIKIPWNLTSYPGPPPCRTPVQLPGPTCPPWPSTGWKHPADGRNRIFFVTIETWDFTIFHHEILVGGWAPRLKNVKSVGMIRNPIYGTLWKIKHVTNQNHGFTRAYHIWSSKVGS